MKQLKRQWDLQQQIQLFVNVFARSYGLSAAVEEIGDISWGNEESPKIGRSAWECGFIAPNGMPPPSIMAPIEKIIARLQARYDIELRCA